MLPLENTLETIKSFTDSFKERKEEAIRNTNPIIIDASALIYNTINNMEEYGDIVEDETKRKYTDTYDEMFQMNEEPQEVRIKNSGILDPNSGTVNTSSEIVMGYWFHPSRDLIMDGLKDMGFIPAIYIGNMETECNSENMNYASQYYNKDKATIFIKLDSRYGNNPDGTPPTIILSECIDCNNTDEFMKKIEEFCKKFKQMIISLRDLTPIESIQIYETLKEEMMNIFKRMQERTATLNTIAGK